MMNFYDEQQMVKNMSEQLKEETEKIGKLKMVWLFSLAVFTTALIVKGIKG